MTEEETALCRKLIEDTNRCIEGLDRAKISGAINWADLGCRGVEKVESYSDYGNVVIEWRVLVEEASPDAYYLQKEIADYLVTYCRHDPVTVVTEW